MKTLTQNEISAFVRLVKKMRSDQREYFAVRSTVALHNSKSEERAVDKMIEEFESPYKEAPLL